MSKLCQCLGLVVLGLITSISCARAAWDESVLHRFGTGLSPLNDLAIDSAGNLYGVTGAGGEYGWGMVFRLKPPTRDHTVWDEELLYSFRGGISGSYPYGGLILDAAGNVYGTTTDNQTTNTGTVFELSPPAKGQTEWTETVLHHFTGGSDGAYSWSTLLLDGAGNLYGTTVLGGVDNNGVVFKLRPPDAEHKIWTEVVLHHFHGGPDGAEPFSNVIFDAAGNLYGTAYTAGASNEGAVFRLSPSDTAQKSWSYEVLHHFTFYDGASPMGGLVIDPAGNIYGTTTRGSYGYGTVFELSPPAAGHTVWSETVLHIFKSRNFVTGFSDGEVPLGSLLLDTAGNLFGTTTLGGGKNCGTVFEVSPPASGQKKWTESVLHQFSGGPFGCGAWGLTFGTEGNLYGTTGGGPVSNGTVFKVVP